MNNLWLSFFFENLHFTISLLIAFVCFSVFWLYSDAWMAVRRVKGVSIAGGWLVLALSFVFEALHLEAAFFPPFLLSSEAHVQLIGITRLAGYVLIIIGRLQDPSQQRPVHQPAVSSSPAVLGMSTAPVWLGGVALPFAAVGAAIMYWRRAVHGLEHHLRPVVIGFSLLVMYEILSLSGMLQTATNPLIYELVAPHGPVWMLQQLALLASGIVLGWWVWHYLLKRLYTQLFIIFVFMTVAVFLVTTGTFTSLLLRNMQDVTLDRLQTDGKVLGLALSSRQAEVLSDAELFARDVHMANALRERNQGALEEMAQSFLLHKRLSFLLIIDEGGRVMVRGEDIERADMVVSNDPLVQTALSGQSLADIVVSEGVLAPLISVRAVAPVETDTGTVGAVLMGVVIDNAFVDSIKTATGLEVTMYGGNTVSATTLQSPDGRTRWVGAQEESRAVIESVLRQSDSLATSMDVLGTPYFAAYFPLLNADAVPVGMMSVGTPQLTVLQVAGRSIQLTFIVVVALIMLAIGPAHIIAKRISRQLQ
jgi:sensor domain CHASE-containing protein